MAKGLGKGVHALFKDMSSVGDEQVQQLSLKDIRPNPYQPRKIFQKESIEELKKSIQQHGILQPIIVRKSIKGFEIVVGERRFRACKEAGLHHIPAVVRDLTDQQMMELAVLENLQREDLTPIEEANAYETLMNKLSITQDQLAKTLGKSRPHIANHVRLLTLPEAVQDHISEGELSMGHGRALLGLKKKNQLEELTEKVIKEKMTVRALEQLIQKMNDVPRETKKKPKKQIPFYREHEGILRERFGTSVAIKKSKNKGKIEIEFMTDDDLERILSLLNENQEV
ncbi:ParB/RepB/Spo0J family partition protein [Jeotgalibacillus sp. ET6]|uniref:ParB/RepB/Spo0J family partition protein n=1 Tax=Jeotgalibacillus sp. ET6 TaxID=3037260 RepID=UPI0024181E54|nr:ParB/RepB/Spo0J family partition protein [Jeotgalibacillus sp. ET6]MDG5473877.1 ParB/RepB/Spo0J family partition protein [Jeotgalibacillus sp. ET6]